MRIFDKGSRQFINKARNLGGKGPTVYLEDVELLRLCMITAIDLDQSHLISNILLDEDVAISYYQLPLTWFNMSFSANVNFVDTFLLLKEHIEDFETYFGKLCELHKRRIKFKRILETQSFQQVEPIVPRCLLEYGLVPSETLASWLVWRKWLYDIDNRSAQETGYLFEPILAAAIGGVPYAAKKSPIKRADSPDDGRQVDCLDGKLAYEFKMRVTIAASGQGRFKEELDFARDCHHSDYVPVLLVLDPTPSARLDDLKAEYARFGGSAYIGNDAWKHIEDRAGTVMGKFVEKYVRIPLREVDRSYNHLLPFHLTSIASEIIAEIGSQTFTISRTRTTIDYEGISEIDADDEP